MNSVSFFGVVDSEPQLLGMPGRDVFEFWLAVNGRRDKHALYVKVTAFKGLACRLAEELSEGDQVAVAGHLRSERMGDGGPRRLYVHSVIARDVQRAGAPRPPQGGEAA